MTKKISIIAFLALFLMTAGVVSAFYLGDGAGVGNSDVSYGTVSAGNSPDLTLNDDEIYWLTSMREEEKVSRDVYLTLNDKWNVPLFKTAAASEQRHMDAIWTLLDRYSIPDPAAGNITGKFTNQTLQGLYDDLILQGSASPSEALAVGIIMENAEINDLNEGIVTARHNDLKTVYLDLLIGSQNYLDSFEKNLAMY